MKVDGPPGLEFLINLRCLWTERNIGEEGLRVQELCVRILADRANFMCSVLYFFVPCGNVGSPSLGKSQQPEEQRYPFLSVCATFSCVRTMAWLPVFGIFNVRADVDACDCTRGLYRHQSLH